MPLTPTHAWCLEPWAGASSPKYDPRADYSLTTAVWGQASWAPRCLEAGTQQHVSPDSALRHRHPLMPAVDKGSRLAWAQTDIALGVRQGLKGFPSPPKKTAKKLDWSLWSEIMPGSRYFKKMNSTQQKEMCILIVSLLSRWRKSQQHTCLWEKGQRVVKTRQTSTGNPTFLKTSGVALTHSPNPSTPGSALKGPQGQIKQDDICEVVGTRVVIVSRSHGIVIVGNRWNVTDTSHGENIALRLNYIINNTLIHLKGTSGPTSEKYQSHWRGRTLPCSKPQADW